jgi:uncharacterized protein YbjQ (UPF0145 family)
MEVIMLAVKLPIIARLFAPADRRLQGVEYLAGAAKIKEVRLLADADGGADGPAVFRSCAAVAGCRPHRCAAGSAPTMSGMTQPVPAASAGFPVTTALGLQGMTVERDLGVAFGLVVRSMGMVKSLGAGFKAMRQGEVTQYTELLEDSRRHAIDRMIENARLLGANAVIAMRFDSSEIGQQLTEIVAYGTAVTTRPAG